MSRASKIAQDDAFQVLVIRELPRLIGLARSLTGNPIDADDLVQETLARAIVHWDKVRDSAHQSAYLRKIMTNTFVSAGRRRWGKEVVSHELAVADPAPQNDPDLAEREEMLGMLRGLPRQQRAVLALRYYEDMPFVQVAQILGCSEGAARTASHRGLAALRDRMSPPGRDPVPLNSGPQQVVTG